MLLAPLKAADVSSHLMTQLACDALRNAKMRMLIFDMRDQQFKSCLYAFGTKLCLRLVPACCRQMRPVQKLLHHVDLRHVRPAVQIVLVCFWHHSARHTVTQLACDADALRTAKIGAGMLQAVPHVDL